MSDCFPFQGDQDHLVLWVPKEELLWVTFPTQVLLEIRDFLALMAQEVRENILARVDHAPLDNTSPTGIQGQRIARQRQ